MQPHPAHGNAEVSRKPWPPPSVNAEPVSLDFLPGADEIAGVVLGFLAELEASLQGSQKAVLASDGLTLENCTREQYRLHRTLEMLLWPQAWPGTGAQQGVQKDVQKEAQKEARNEAQKDVRESSLPGKPRFVSECAPQLAAELLAAEGRVLHATRVQAALLQRVRQFQRILANVAAAQGAPCGAWFGQSPQR